MPTSVSPSARTHIVLVPGFGGFDVLGQMQYYAGLTPVFRKWQAEAPGDPRRARAVLHYFDNIPTAAVATRAARLRSYLAKRIARNEIQADDTVALVGHSTGGLDIRWLLWTLVNDPQARKRLDGNRDNAMEVSNEALLDRLRRVVFLSVPQRGTNAADWLLTNDRPRRFATEALRDAVERLLARNGTALGLRVTRLLAERAGSDLFRAAEDVLRETDERRFAGITMDVTAALAAVESREAFAHLWLWSRNIAADFSAISDLMSGPPGHEPRSPAHLGDEERGLERERWKEHGIVTRSYATFGACPYEPDVLRDRSPWSFLDLRPFGGSGILSSMLASTDLIYRLCYRACIGGPFAVPEGPREATVFGTTDRRAVEVWENDGIVNTASMLSPDGGETFLVKADHADIIGHFRLVEVPSQDDARGEEPRPGAARSGLSGRRYHTYDLLRSNSGFREEQFSAVWRDVFGFCLSPS